MIAYKCDRCGEHYDGEPAARISIPYRPDRHDLCGSCWAMIRSTIGTPGTPLKETAA